MDPFPPSRAEAVRLARERGEGLGEKMQPPGSQRQLQPIVDKFFYGLYANQIETQRLGLWGDPIKVRCDLLPDGGKGCLLGFVTPMHGDKARGHGVEIEWDSITGPCRFVLGPLSS